jgi:hypothetical protein
MSEKTSDLFNEKDLLDAVDDLSTLPYFPADSRGSVLTFLRKACPNRTALRWLVSEAINHLDRWPGLAGLRGILCTRYDAADGIDQYCNLPGYRAEDAEAKHYEKHSQLKVESRPNPDLLRLVGGRRSR